MSAKPSSKKVTSRVWERPGTTRYKDPELTAQREREAALTARQQSKAKSGHGPVLVARKTVTLSADESSPFLSSLITPERVKAQWAARQGLDSASHNDPIYYQHGLSHEEVTSMLGELDEPLLSSASQPTSFASASSNKESNLKLFSEQSAKENAKNVLRREIAQRILGLDTMNNAELLKVHIQQAIHHFQRRGPLDSGSADVQGRPFFSRHKNVNVISMGRPSRHFDGAYSQPRTAPDGQPQRHGQSRETAAFQRSTTQDARLPPPRIVEALPMDRQSAWSPRDRLIKSLCLHLLFDYSLHRS